MRDLLDPAICRDSGTIYGYVDSVRLKEHDSGATLKELVITGLPAGAMVADLDPIEGIGSGQKVRLKRYSWFFKDQNPIATKQCDGAVYCEVGGVNQLIMIELKSSLSGLAKGRKQLSSGCAFAAYLEKLTGKSLRVVSRLVYVGPPRKTPALASAVPAMPDHAEIPVTISVGRAYLTYRQLIAA